LSRIDNAVIKVFEIFLSPDKDSQNYKKFPCRIITGVIFIMPEGVSPAYPKGVSPACPKGSNSRAFSTYCWTA